MKRLLLLLAFPVMMACGYHGNVSSPLLDPRYFGEITYTPPSEPRPVNQTTVKTKPTNDERIFVYMHTMQKMGMSDMEAYRQAKMQVEWENLKH